MNLILSLATSPPTIQDASLLWLEEFGLELRFCRNRTLSLVLGPDSHAGVLARLITAVLHGKQAQARLVLYSRAGTGTLFHVRAQPSRTGAGMELELSHCDAVALVEAVREDGSVKVLLEAKRPFRVVHASSAFLSAYGFESKHITNRTLQAIHGPSTDINAWKQMLDGGLSGSAQSAYIKTYTCNGSDAEGLTHVRVMPVMGAGDIEHLLIAMGHDSVPLWRSGMSEASDFPRSGQSVTQRADKKLSGLDGCVRRVIEELRATPCQCKSAKTPIPECATTGVLRRSSVSNGVPGTPRCMKAEPLPVRSSKAATKRQSSTISMRKPCRTLQQIHDIPEASCFASIMYMVMTLLCFLGVGCMCSSRAQPMKRRTSAYECNWEMLHFDGIHHHQ